MIKIKNHIYNENEIRYIEQGWTKHSDLLYIHIKGKDTPVYVNYATFDDIEWNYGSQVEEHKRDYDLLIERHNKLFNDYKELEEENKKLKEESSIKHIREVQQKNIEYVGRIDKAIKMIKGTQFYGMRSGKTLLSKYFNDLINILKGEENEN